MEVVVAFSRVVEEPVPTVEVNVNNLAEVVKLSTEFVAAVQVLVIEPQHNGAALSSTYHQIICKETKKGERKEQKTKLSRGENEPHAMMRRGVVYNRLQCVCTKGWHFAGILCKKKTSFAILMWHAADGDGGAHSQQTLIMRTKSILNPNLNVRAWTTDECYI